MNSIDMGSNNENDRVNTPENVHINLNENELHELQ